MNKKLLIDKTDLLAFFGGLYIFMIPAKPILPISFFYGLGIFCLILTFISIDKYKIKPKFFELNYLLFYFVCVAGIFYTKSEYATSLCTRILLYIIGVFSSIKLLSNKNDNINLFYKASNYFIYGTLFISFYCLIREGINDVRLGEIVFEGVYGTYIELSLCLLISTILILHQIFFKKDKSPIKYIIFILLIMFCILSQTRKVFIGILFLIIFCGFWKSKNSLKLKLKYLIIGMLCLISFIYAINNFSFLNNIKTRFNGLILYVQEKDTYDNSSIAREKMRNIALNKFYESPIIGNGTDSARVFIKSSLGLNVYSHCNFTELLCNYGIIGFCIYYFYHIVILLKSSLYSKRDKIVSGIIISSLLVLIITDYGQVSYYNVEFIFIYLLLSYLYSTIAKQKTMN